MRIGVRVLTLDDRPDRRRSALHEAARLPVPVVEMSSSRPASAGAFSAPGVRGCFESHLAALKELRDEDVDLAIVCEDDLLTTRVFKRRFAAVAVDLAELDSWSIAYLGYDQRLSPNDKPRIRYVGAAVAEVNAWELRGTHLYAVGRSALGDLIDYLQQSLDQGAGVPYDGALNDFRRARGEWVLLPRHSLAIQSPSPSTIAAAGRRWNPGPTTPVGRFYWRLRKSVRRVQYEVQSWRGLPEHEPDSFEPMENIQVSTAG